MLRFLGCFLALTSGLSAVPKENVLFLAVDDMATWLGCYGHPLAKTPHLDALAKRGVTFERAYCQFPLCSPSRSSLMTGLLPDHTTVYDLKKHFRSVKPDVVTLGQYFQKQGYFAARVGKIYHYGNPGEIGTPGLDDAPTWNLAMNPRGRDKDEEHLLTKLTPKRGLGASLTYLAAEGTDEEQTDGKVATEAIRLLEEKKADPFFLAVGFYRPHCPYIAPKKYFDLYPKENIPLASFDKASAAALPWQSLASTKPWPYMGVTPEQLRDATQAYLATISFVDAQIGRVLAALDRLKLTEKTHIVFWSDHGYHLGEHGLIFKMSVFEQSARVPMIIAGPAVKAVGKVCAAPVELLDIYPTLVEATGGTPAKELDGLSLLPQLADASTARPRPALTQVTATAPQQPTSMGYSLRTPTHRLTVWHNPNEALGTGKVQEFYHELSDPKEERNLASSEDETNKKLMESLRQELVERLKH
jgi:iduronate 2-sulfatase